MESRTRGPSAAHGPPDNADRPSLLGTSIDPVSGIFARQSSLQLLKLPQRFILFCDDLSFEAGEGEQIGGEPVRVFLFVATLGYSRRGFACAFRHERQSAWFAGIEAAFAHFGGRPQTLLIDNAKALVDKHDTQTRQVRLNSRFEAFCRHWDVRVRACAPFSARTKG